MELSLSVMTVMIDEEDAGIKIRLPIGRSKARRRTQRQQPHEEDGASKLVLRQCIEVAEM
ncbi:hypothetical protein ACLOJK_023012 [Asimina triloba]